MSKSVLIISTSPRKDGNSDTLAEEFAKGARETGNQVEKIVFYDKTIGFCKGCLACQKSLRCVIHDEADTIAQKMLTADVIVFATPIYYYEMCVAKTITSAVSIFWAMVSASSWITQRRLFWQARQPLQKPMVLL